MTAVVGILNKQAIAIAADSAVTIGGSNGNKIFNRANKVFTLSKFHPVGIMLYNSASFLGTPWETIIKMYRKQLKDNSFPRVEDYKIDFLRYLHSKSFFTDEVVKRKYIEHFFKTSLDMLVNEALVSKKDLLINPTEENKILILSSIEIEIDKFNVSREDNHDCCPDIEQITLEDFNDYTNEQFDNSIDYGFSQNEFVPNANFLEKLKLFLFNLFRLKETITNYTGLIFVGFGEDEIYPQLLPINVSLAFKDKLRYYDDDANSGKINDMNDGAICPFAQTDVINTILTGIDPVLDNTYQENLKNTFIKYNNLVLAEIGDTSPELSEKIRNVDLNLLMHEFNKMNQETKSSNYIVPLMNAVSSLSKEDLAEMAESLIYLTYLKRRITFAEESVGGPVDVAIISKGDGFIWFKRKHYFKPELNKYFFDNYFN